MRYESGRKTKKIFVWVNVVKTANYLFKINNCFIKLNNKNVT